MPTFQYISDIHLEFGAPPPTIPPAADVLLLAGDIGDPTSTVYAEFLATVAADFRQVFIIAGNHEYYGRRTRIETEELIRAQPNVIFLQDEAHQVLDTDIWIFGSTLWTAIPDDPAVHARLTSGIADYRRIKWFTPYVAADLHKAAVDAFTRLRPTARRWIVLCHHQPATNLIDPQYRGFGALNWAFASDVPALTEGDDIEAVVYGHTHRPYQNGKFYCNPVGYPGEHATPPNTTASFTLPAVHPRMSAPQPHSPQSALPPPC